MRKHLVPLVILGTLLHGAFADNATVSAASQEAAAEQQLPWAKAQAAEATQAVSAFDAASFRSRLQEAGLPENRALELEADMAAVAANYAAASEALAGVLRNAAKLKEFDPQAALPPVPSEDAADALRAELSPLRDRLRLLESQLRVEEQSLERSRSLLESATKDLRRAVEEADSASAAALPRALIQVEIATAREEALSAQVFLNAWRLYADQLDRRYLTLLITQKSRALEASGFNSFYTDRRVRSAGEKAQAAVAEVSSALEVARKRSAELAVAATAVEEQGPSASAGPAAKLAEENATLAARTARALEIWLDVVHKSAAIWELVGQAVQNPDSSELLESVRDSIRSLQAELAMVREQLQSTTTETARQLTELASAPKSNDPAMRRLETQRAELLSARDAFMRQATVTLAGISDVLEGLAAETGERLAARTLRERTARTGAKVADWAQRIWDTDLFTTEDKVIAADGSSVVRHRGVSLGQLASAVLAALVGIVIAGWLGRVAGSHARQKFGAEPVRAASIDRLVFFGVSAAVALSALHYLHIPLTAFAFLGGALAIGIGFGAQTVMSNFISGLLLTAERRIKPGDTIEVDGHRGKVLTLGTRCAYIQRVDGVEVLIPNSFLLEKTVANWTLSDTHHRAELRLGVAYGSNPTQVMEMLEGIAREQPGILQTPSPQVFFEDFGDSALMFVVYYWVDLRVADLREEGSRMRLSIDTKCRETGIEIAFPQREIHLSAEAPIRIAIEPQS